MGLHLAPGLIEPRYPAASAHGRFQPLHNGHLEYLLAAKVRCEFLWVGITQFVVSELMSAPNAGPHRTARDSNPLTYYERAIIVHEALLECGVAPTEFTVAPFPIEQPALVSEFLPTNIPVFTTIYDDWNRQKVLLLQEQGYTVHVLWERREKRYTGERVRRLIAARNPEYLAEVPSATARFIEEARLWMRLSPSPQHTMQTPPRA